MAEIPCAIAYNPIYLHSTLGELLMSTATQPINPLPKALTPDELDALRAVPKNPRDQALIEVMAGCGLRVSEALNLTLDALHWTTDKPALRFTGKRRKERIVPMNFEVQDAMRTWLDARDRIPNAGDFIFCHLRSGSKLSRQAVWMALDRYARQAGCRHVHPHMLRHSFGTALANGNVPVERIRELMGHASIEVSQIYISVSTEQKRQAVEQIDLRPRWLRWLSRQRNRTYRFFSRPVQRKTFSAQQTVGRQAELQQLGQNLKKGIDTLVLGSVGVGKSHLLNLLGGEPASLLQIPRLTPIRQAIIGMAEALYQHGVLKLETETQEESPARSLSKAATSSSELGAPTPEETAEGEWPVDSISGAGIVPGRTFDEIKKQHMRTSVQGWTQRVLDSVEKGTWTLVIDDLSDLTTSTGRLIDQLAGKFTIIAAMQYVKKAQGKHFWKFERLEVGPLASDEARRLIRQCAAGVEIEDERLFETHLLQKSAGNPRAIIESVERLRKEPAVTRNAVRELSHAGGRTQIDLTPIIIIPVLLLVALRFVARGLGDLEFYLFAGVGSALAVGVQFFLFRSRNR